MTIATTLDAVAALLRRADSGLVVGTPTAGIKALCAWPRRLAQRPATGTSLPLVGQPPRPTMSFDLHLLVLQPDAGSAATLDRALAPVAANPPVRTAARWSG